MIESHLRVIWIWLRDNISTLILAASTVLPVIDTLPRIYLLRFLCRPILLGMLQGLKRIAKFTLDLQALVSVRSLTVIKISRCIVHHPSHCCSCLPVKHQIVRLLYNHRSYIPHWLTLLLKTGMLKTYHGKSFKYRLLVNLLRLMINGHRVTLLTVSSPENNWVAIRWEIHNSWFEFRRLRCHSKLTIRCLWKFLMVDIHWGLVWK